MARYYDQIPHIAHLPVKMGKFTRLRSAIRFASFSKHFRASTTAISSSPPRSSPSPLQEMTTAAFPRTRHDPDWFTWGSHYKVSADVFGHSLFQELLVQAVTEDDEEEASSTPTPGRSAVMSCKVVLFEHLLGMLENEGPSLGSTDELVKFYTCLG